MRSGASVFGALKRAGHEAEQLDPLNGLPATLLKAADAVFPVLHGKGGEDGEIQRQLEQFGVPYVGSGVEASELCSDKWRYKQHISFHKLPVPSGRVVGEDEFWKSELIKRPFVLKPNDGGSSVDTYIYRGGRIARETVAAIFSRHTGLLLEELIEGAESTVAVLGDRALPVIEIIPPESGEFDYENKYNGKSRELCPPEHIPEATQIELQNLALQAHNLAGCRDFSRTDIMITPDGALYILETNTIPGMTDQSLFPKAAAAAGIPMEELVNQLVQMALARQA